MEIFLCRKRREKEEGRRKKEEGRRKKEKGRRKKRVRFCETSPRPSAFPPSKRGYAKR
ncbi:MAG: hypothetical protein FWF85_07060 [Clostridiales bacterium]|nr:hypothetical protein [Clostridiales bacterium]